MTELIPRTKGTFRMLPDEPKEEQIDFVRLAEIVMPRYVPSQAGLDALQASIDRFEAERGKAV